MSYINSINRIAREIDSLVPPSSDGLAFVHHFDYPETISYSGNSTIVQNEHKFGKACAFFQDNNSKIIISNSSGLFNISPVGNYEFEAFVKFNKTPNNSDCTIFNADDLILRLAHISVSPGDNSYKYFNGHTFKLFDNPLSWADAKSACEALGGHLATSTSEDKNSFLANLSDIPVWLGATNENNEGSWSWITGEQWNFSNWSDNQPDNSSSNEHFLQLHNYSWQDNSATDTAAYICEWDYGINVCLSGEALNLSCNTFSVDNSKFMTVDNSAFSDYSFYGGHSFRLFNSPMTFSQAANSCSWAGGTLANSNNDEDKSNFLHSLTDSNTWLDVTDDISEDTRPFICEWDYDLRSLVFDFDDAFYDNWHHILLRLHNSFLTLFFDGIELFYDYVSASDTLIPNQLELGGFIGYIDEFAFRQNSSDDDPVVPEYPYDLTIVQNSTSIITSNAPVSRVAWSCDNLPEGLTLSQSGLLTGHPTAAGTYDCNFSVSTNWGTDNKTLRIVIQ